MTRRRRQEGFILVAAIFLIVALGILGAYVFTISMVQQATSGMAILSARAYAAAQSGLEWASYRALQNGSCASASFTLSEGTFSGYQVNVNCALTTHRVRDVDLRNFVLTVTASTGSYGQPDFTSRTVTATVGDVP